VKRKLRFDKWHAHDSEELYKRMKCAVHKAFYYMIYLDYERRTEDVKQKLKNVLILDECI